MLCLQLASKWPWFADLCPIFYFLFCFSFPSLKDFKEFADAIEAAKHKGVVVAVASPDDVDAANKEHPNFFQVKKAL